MIIKGTKINNRYSIIRTIGEGGMANVYLAYDTILDRNVAVKVLRGDLRNDEKFVRRFQREALSASSLNHPNIVEMYDVGEDDGEYYIVMEYVEGKTLKQLLKKRGSLTITEVIDIMSQLTDGMAHAHDSYIIHRDIKPQNIMILENGMIKITDFGIAMALNSTQLTQTNSVMGSVHYLPPEQAAGKGCTIKSDIYSMGILMYELLTGSVPFKGDNAVEIALKQLKEPIPSIRKKLPELPQSVENIIIKATAKNPMNRYKDAREMHQDIITCLDEQRANEPKYVYPYPENDIDNTKKVEVPVKETKKQEIKKEENDFDMVKEVEGSDKSQNKILIILACVFAGLIVVITAVVFLLPKLSKGKTLEVPDVSNLSKVDASNALTKKGFVVKCSDGDYKYTPSDEIKEGFVVKTDPEKGTIVKEGKSICIYISSGDATFVMPDYSTVNYIEAKTILETKYNCNVVVEIEKVTDEEKYKGKEDKVIRTSPGVDENVKYGSSVTLYIPELEILYPDFTDGSYTLEMIQEYANKYKLKLEIKEEVNSLLPSGTIISQSRPAKSVVTEGVTLTITVAKTPEAVEGTITPSEDNESEKENTNR